MEWFFFFLVLLFIIVAVAASGQAKALAKAREAYQLSLRDLANNPTSPDLRRRTLDLGRAYSRLTRNNKGVTLFDEVALMNDINAACAGASSVAATSAPTTSISLNLSLEDRLKQLTQLKTRGLISEAEYQSKRQKILDEV